MKLFQKKFWDFKVEPHWRRIRDVSILQNDFNEIKNPAIYENVDPRNTSAMW